MGYPITSNAVFGAGAGDEEGTEEAVGANRCLFFNRFRSTDIDGIYDKGDG